MTLNKESLERLWQHIIARLGQKVDKEEGKGLSSCDFTAEEKEKLKGLETNARADWNETDPTSASYIINTPTEVENSVIVEWDGVITEDTPTIGGTLYKASNYNDTNPSKISGVTAYIPGQGEIFLSLDEESLDVTEENGISTLICEYFIIASAPIEPYVPEAGTYLMYMPEQNVYVKALNGKINVVKEENISKKIARIEDLHTVAKTGSWNDLEDKPTIPSTIGLATEEYVNIRVPAWTNADEGKVLKIVNGVPTWASLINYITFTVGDYGEYTAEEGMTWGEWCSSEYNTYNWMLNEPFNSNSEITQGDEWIVDNSGTRIKGTDIIINNYEYSVIRDNTV